MEASADGETARPVPAKAIMHHQGDSYSTRVVRSSGAQKADRNNETSRSVASGRAPVGGPRVVLVDAFNTESQDRFLALPPLTEAGLQVSVLEGHRPRLKIYDVSSRYGKEDLLSEIVACNFESEEPETIKKGLNLEFKDGPKGLRTTNWVASVTPEVRFLLLRRKRIPVSWQGCRVVDHVSVSRCFKCQRYT